MEVEIVLKITFKEGKPLGYGPGEITFHSSSFKTTAKSNFLCGPLPAIQLDTVSVSTISVVSAMTLLP